MIKSLKQARKLAREQEIALYGKTICHHYDRKVKRKHIRVRTNIKNNSSNTYFKHRLSTNNRIVYINKK